MISRQTMVTEFHRAFGARVNEPPSRMLFFERWRLIVEEFAEFTSAFLGGVPESELEVVREHLWSLIGYLSDDVTPQRAEDIAKEGADLLYVIYGAGANLGINLDVAFTAVHANNVAKIAHSHVDEHGKLVKPNGWAKPDLTHALPSRYRVERTEDL